MSTRWSGLARPQLHHRQQAVAAGDHARLGAEPAERRDRAVDAGRPLVLEWRRCLLQAPWVRDAGAASSRGADVVAVLVLDRESVPITGERGSSCGASWRTSGYSFRAARLPPSTFRSTSSPPGLTAAIGASRPRRASISVLLMYTSPIRGGGDALAVGEVAQPRRARPG